MANPSQKTFVLVRFGISVTQACKNSLTQKLSIIRNYGGRVVGVGDQIKLVEGSWPLDKGLAVLEFDTPEGAYWFAEATPEINQHDWLGGVDFISVKCRALPSNSKRWFQVSDVVVHDRDTYMVEYVPGHQDVARKAGATLAVVDNKEVTKYRGLWDPHQLVIHQWGSDKEFEDWQCSQDNARWEEMRKSICSCNTVLVKLDPLPQRGC